MNYQVLAILGIIDDPSMEFNILKLKINENDYLYIFIKLSDIFVNEDRHNRNRESPFKFIDREIPEKPNFFIYYNTLKIDLDNIIDLDRGIYNLTNYESRTRNEKILFSLLNESFTLHDINLYKKCNEISKWVSLIVKEKHLKTFKLLSMDL